jgi:tRNA U34 5-methylaminomethyl-2-thiouridine-forming methyltransferase MnmC
MNAEIILTSDGSHTLFVPSMNEHYHSTFGAVSESKHVFLQNGLLYSARRKKSLSVLEVGFGTGLNAFLTCLEAAKIGLYISYTSIEPDPLEADVYAKLNYPDFIQEENATGLFISFHESPWDTVVPVTDFFKLLKIRDEVLHVALTDGAFDCIFFDAFGPMAQPVMWSEEIFAKMYNVLQPGGILVTYCAKGSVRRTMKAVGFEIEKLPGAPGKREMTRAIK